MSAAVRREAQRTGIGRTPRYAGLDEPAVGTRRNCPGRCPISVNITSRLRWQRIGGGRPLCLPRQLTPEPPSGIPPTLATASTGYAECTWPSPTALLRHERRGRRSGKRPPPMRLWLSRPSHEGGGASKPPVRQVSAIDVDRWTPHRGEFTTAPATGTERLSPPAPWGMSPKLTLMGRCPGLTNGRPGWGCCPAAVKSAGLRP